MEDSYKNSLNRDPLANASDTPDVLSLNNELQRCFYHGANAGELIANDDLRFCRWEGQTVDGKKHDTKEGKSTAPFDGASDVRIRLIDRVINETVAMLINAWKMAKMGVSGKSIDDAQSAAGMEALMKHVNSRLKSDIRREFELYAQYGNQYGWSAIHVGWDQQIGLREQIFKLEDIIKITEGSQEGEEMSMLNMLPSYIQNPETEDMAVSIISQRIPNVKLSEIKNMVRDLRNTGSAKFYEETITRNLASVTALKPWDEIGFPPETIEFQKARVVFRRLFMTEVELRSMENADGWDSNAIDIALTTTGKQSWYNDPNIIPRAAQMNKQLYRNNNLVEVIYAYTRQIDSDGIPQIYYTAFCPKAGDKTYFKHEKLGYAHGNYPFVIYRRENVRKNTSESRGIPEILMTEQAELKAQHDALRDRTSFETVPPLIMKRRLGGVGKIGPAQQIAVSDVNDIKWMEPPRGSPNIAELVINHVETNVAKYFGLTSAMTEKQPTQHAMMIQQVAVDNFLTSISEVYSHILQLSLQYMDEVEIERVVGFPLTKSITDISNQFDFELKFDVRNMYMDFVMEKLQAVNQSILPIDSGGVIDRTQLVRIAIEAIIPEKADELILDNTAASGKMFQSVQNDIGNMMLGNEPQYVENDPTAKNKMSFVQDIMSKNPKAQSAAQQDPVFQALFKNYIKNLQMSVSQQQNKVIGRIGVTPVGNQMAQEQQPQQPQMNNETV